MDKFRRGVRGSPQPDRGASAVELALVMPIFLILVFAIVAFGILFAQKLSLGNSARQAARYGVVANRTCADVVNQARDSMDGTINLAPSSVQVSVKRGQSSATASSVCASDSATTKPCEGAANNDSLFVTTSYTSTFLIPLAVSKDDMLISGTGVFRCEFR